MGLQDRLAAFRAQGTALPRPPSQIGWYDPDGPPPAPPAALQAACAALAGLTLEETTAGPALVRLQLVTPASGHHRDALRQLASSTTGALRPLAAGPVPEVPFAGSLVLDLETTSGAGGSGTGIVVLGAGRPVPEGLLVAQAVVTGPGHEPAALAWLARWAAGTRAVLTWNGASFDLPVLQARAVLGRQPWPLPDAVHLDLLPIARRTWRHDLPSRRLTEVERSLLGIERPDDLPGALIPALWQDVRASGDWQRLEPVLHHNAADLLGLALAATELIRVASGAAATTGERLALAQAWERHGDPEQARRWFLAAAPPPGSPFGPAGEEALWQAARFLRRRDGPAAAIPYLERLAQHGTRHRDSALLQLARLAEWHLRDLDLALEHTRRLLQAPPHPGRTALEHRQRRLLRRTGRQEPAPTQPAPASAPPPPGPAPAPGTWLRRFRQLRQSASRPLPGQPGSPAPPLPGNCGTVE